jgi:hypothetical protein
MRLTTFLAALAAFLFPLGAPAEDASDRSADRTRVEGRLELAVEDYPDGKHETIAAVVTDDGRRVPLELAGGGLLEGWRSGERIAATVSGGAAGAARPLLVNAERPEGGRRASATSSWTTGPKSLLVLLVNFTDDTSQPFTPAATNTLYFGSSNSVAGFYAEASYGVTSLSGTVAGYYTLPMTKPTTCSVAPIATYAQAAATAQGINVGSYQFISYIFPKINACGWLGYSNIGAAGNWLNGYMTLRIAGHELGHSYGLLHAHSLTCSSGPISGTCSRSEYGDDFDIMGNEPGHFQAAAKQSLAWMSDVVDVASGSATVTIYPLEGSSMPRAVRIPLSSLGRNYFLEYRRPLGYDASVVTYPGAIDGPLVHQQTSAGLDILDMKPATNGDFTDAALSAGSSFVDSAANLTVTVLSTSSSSTTVQVSFGGSGPPPPPSPTKFYALTPCRIADTREPNGPTGGPALATGATRTFTLTGTCGVPSGATALSLNVAVVGGTSGGTVATSFGTAVVSFAAGMTRSTIAVLPLDASGRASLCGYFPSGAVQVILDVSGYYR